jgi:predicted acylesterase/phospholipase RssA
MRVACAEQDIYDQLLLIRELSRKAGGIKRASLYAHSHVGTKKLVEEYLQASVRMIDELVELTKSVTLPEGWKDGDILRHLQRAKQNFGTTALILSGGSVNGMAHIGVVKALWKSNLLPKIISGTSAGSIVAAVVCTKRDKEIPAVLDQFALGDLAVFTDAQNPDSWRTHIWRAFTQQAWHDNRHLARVMKELLGEMTFQQNYNRTGRVLNITVSSKPGLQLPALLNYKTAPNVLVWSAVVASCSVPGVFDPSPLLIRDEETGETEKWDPTGQKWMDGSLDNDVPVDRLGELLGVNHFIVSQANPHVAFFLSREEKRVITKSSQHHSQAETLMDRVLDLGRFQVETAMENVIGWHVMPELLQSPMSMFLTMLQQPYTADINIVPRMSLRRSAHALLRNPTPEFMLEACRVGEMSTWPLLCRIENSLAIELALDRAIRTLKERVTFSKSQVELMRLRTGTPELGDPGTGLRERRHRRTHSGGHIQLKIRRKFTMSNIDPRTEESHDDSDIPPTAIDATSLVARRGLDSLSLPIDRPSPQAPPGHPLAKQSSLVSLPLENPAYRHLPKSPAPGNDKILGEHLSPLTSISRVSVSSSSSSSSNHPSASAGSDSDEASLPIMSARRARRRPSAAADAARIAEVAHAAAAAAEDADDEGGISSPAPVHGGGGAAGSTRAGGVVTDEEAADEEEGKTEDNARRVIRPPDHMLSLAWN